MFLTKIYIIMKKITLLFMMFGLMLSTSLTAQVYYSVSMNGGTAYSSETQRFAGYPWGGVGNHVFDNSNSENITLEITNYDEATVGAELYIRFSRVGFGKGTLNWGSDNSTDLVTLVPADFTNGAATVTVNIPNGTVPVAQTTDYVTGYNYVLQVVGDNDPEAYINYVVDITETIVLSTNDFSTAKLAAFYSSGKDAVVISDKNIIGNDFKLYDLTGRTLMNGEISDEINVSNLKSGLYFLATKEGTLKFAK